MAGEPKAWVTFQSRRRLDNFGGIDRGRVRRVHVGNHGRHAHRAVEQPEQRKRRQIDLAGLDIVKIVDLLHLGVEIAVGVEHAFGRAGAAGGEDDGRRLVGRRGGQLAAVPRAAAELVER